MQSVDELKDEICGVHVRFDCSSSIDRRLRSSIIAASGVIPGLSCRMPAKVQRQASSKRSPPARNFCEPDMRRDCSMSSRSSCSTSSFEGSIGWNSSCDSKRCTGFTSFRLYLAYSTERTSRITVILISPGYCISCSIFWAMSRAILALILSSTSLASTMTRTSRPAWMA